ncbi:hypothetical protein BC828DRAFT_381219 [Blastocladiella britannica]|nr:hypothetical protein BC828DRAFT_381219 [Blastocladiella britannica]
MEVTEDVCSSGSGGCGESDTSFQSLDSGSSPTLSLADDDDDDVNADTDSKNDQVEKEEVEEAAIDAVPLTGDFSLLTRNDGQFQPLRLFRTGAEYAAVVREHATYIPAQSHGLAIQESEETIRDDDLYTPRWTRGVSRDKEAMCRLCPPEAWYKTKVSAYWYHLMFYHGISAKTGRPHLGPTAVRLNESGSAREGRCHSCKQWKPLDNARHLNAKVPEILWWKHAKDCHLRL